MNIDSLMELTCFAHSRQVSEISALLADGIGYTQEETAVIRQAALLHDIGKSDIPEHLLNKPGELTQEEFAVIKTHTELGYYKIMDAINALSVAAEVCRYHHERLDGAGYVHMTGQDIHPYTRLISVADVFDALYSKRAYKPAWEVSEIKAFFAHSEKQFDSDIVKLLFSLIDRVLTLYRTENV